MTRMTGPDCAIMCNLINTHIHIRNHTHREREREREREVFVTTIVDPPMGGSMRVA